MFRTSFFLWMHIITFVSQCQSPFCSRALLCRGGSFLWGGCVCVLTGSAAAAACQISCSSLIGAPLADRRSHSAVSDLCIFLNTTPTRRNRKDQRVRFVSDLGNCPWTCLAPGGAGLDVGMWQPDTSWIRGAQLGNYRSGQMLQLISVFKMRIFVYL